jgi:hypothetical protein
MFGIGAVSRASKLMGGVLERVDAADRAGGVGAEERSGVLRDLAQVWGTLGVPSRLEMGGAQLDRVHGALGAALSTAKGPDGLDADHVHELAVQTNAAARAIGNSLTVREGPIVVVGLAGAIAGACAWRGVS